MSACGSSIKIKNYKNKKHYEEEINLDNVSLMTLACHQEYNRDMKVDRGLKEKYTKINPETGKSGKFQTFIFKNKTIKPDKKESNNKSRKYNTREKNLDTSIYSKIKISDLVQPRLLKDANLSTLIIENKNGSKDRIFWNYNR